MLRAKATSSPTSKVYSIDHDLELYLEKPTNALPIFDKTTCYEFFKKSFKRANQTKKIKLHLGYCLFHHLRKIQW